MKVRLRLQALTAAVGDPRFHVVIIVEDTWTGDYRLFERESLTWRDLPLPLMATDKADHGSFSADTATVLIGNIEEIERVGDEIHGYGAWITDPDPEAADLILRVQKGELRGLSADIDNVEYEILYPAAVEESSEETIDNPADESQRETIDDVEYIVIEESPTRMRVTEGRIMGATVVPFPALQEAMIESLAADSDTPADEIELDDETLEVELVAAVIAEVLAEHHLTGLVSSIDYPQPSNVIVTHEPEPDALTAAGEIPVVPPRDWFFMEEPDEPTPHTFTPDGRFYGHLALWDECHIGYAGECVSPPSSPSNYARFHVGEIACDDGSRVAIGRLTFATGHAPLGMRSEAARAHYDNTGTVAADIRAIDGVHGIWACGAARPNLTAAQMREIMACPPSGDWRLFGGELEMVAALCVNVPGFNTARVRRDEGLVASLIATNVARLGLRNASTEAPTRRADERTLIAKIAASIGAKTPEQRIAEAIARVKENA